MEPEPTFNFNDTIWNKIKSNVYIVLILLGILFLLIIIILVLTILIYLNSRT